jgi:hypothetical protein
MVMEKNKHELNETKKPFPRKDPQTEESEKSKRKAVSIHFFLTNKSIVMCKTNVLCL